jgi:hypothetical protein
MVTEETWDQVSEDRRIRAGNKLHTCKRTEKNRKVFDIGRHNLLETLLDNKDDLFSLVLCEGFKATAHLNWFRRQLYSLSCKCFYRYYQWSNVLACSNGVTTLQLLCLTQQQLVLSALPTPVSDTTYYLQQRSWVAEMSKRVAQKRGNTTCQCVCQLH